MFTLLRVRFSTVTIIVGVVHCYNSDEDTKAAMHQIIQGNYDRKQHLFCCAGAFVCILAYCL